MSANADNPAQGVGELIRHSGYTAMVENLFSGIFVGAPPTWKSEKMAQGLSVSERPGLRVFRSVTEWDAVALQAAADEIDVPVHVIYSTTLGSYHERRSLESGDTSPCQRLALPDASVGTASAL